MKILVCFKTVPDLDSLHADDWRGGESLLPETRFVRSIINPLDESALELALRACEAASGHSLHALTIGDEKADTFLKTLLALGFDEARRVAAPRVPLFNPEAMARIIAEQATGRELIIMGGQSADGANAATPLLTAEILGWPAVTELSGITITDDLIEVESQTDDGILCQLIRPPAVLAVGNAPFAFLRVPTLKDRMGRGKRAIEIIKQAEIAEIFPISLTVEEHRRAALEIRGDSAAEKAAAIWREHIEPRLEKRRP